ncbi:uncharacterized protein LOC107037893 [Diachasma alloeum]|uniref:uncharacterized protein LOC107037893 n=1 Tax=Diachasma alloeum TaxID=454923 RepID=UPI0007383917|nr:uncharacterized protein LOC107037893 [Diachasma alloeum]XP_015112187.1 uncharacterized protein LOC107037893 [Diachasma alloeum]
MQPSVAFTPTVVHPIPQIDRSLVPVSYCSRRFRRILPKLEPNAVHNSEVLPSVPTTEAVPNPYIIIIPRVDNTKPSTPNNVRLPRVSKRKAILRITINKMSNTENTDVLNESTATRGDHNGLDTRVDEGEPQTERVEVRNYKLNRSVVFSLDPVTGEILVTKRAIKSSTCDNGDVEGNVNTRQDSSQGVKCCETTEKVRNPCADAGGQCDAPQGLNGLDEKGI